MRRAAYKPKVHEGGGSSSGQQERLIQPGIIHDLSMHEIGDAGFKAAMAAWPDKVSSLHDAPT